MLDRPPSSTLSICDIKNLAGRTSVNDELTRCGGKSVASDVHCLVADGACQFRRSRAQWSERADPFAHLGPAQSNRASTRGPGWQRASQSGRFNRDPQRVIEAKASAVSLGNQGRTDLELGQRVFHGKFGYGKIVAQEGNKLEIEFEHAGLKKVLDSFVSAS